MRALKLVVKMRTLWLLFDVLLLRLFQFLLHLLLSGHLLHGVQDRSSLRGYLSFVSALNLFLGGLNDILLHNDSDKPLEDLTLDAPALEIADPPFEYGDGRFN